MQNTLSRRSFLAATAAMGLVAALPAGLAFADEKATKPETVTIKSFNAEKKLVDLEVPFDPQRIAILDMASMDIIDNLGLGDRIVGMPTNNVARLEYVAEYAENEDIVNLGTIKTADLEATMECEPDIIFIGGRLASVYDTLSEIAPVVYLGTDVEIGVVESTKANALTIASIFGLEEQVEEKFEGFGARIEAINEFSEGLTAVVGLCTSGSLNVLGNDGRCSIIGVELGFTNLAAADTEDGEEAVAEVTSTHGNESSFETIVRLDADWMFIMDRDAATGAEGAQLAQEIVENELVMTTRAYQDGHIVYLSHPSVWYTAEGGISALDVMLRDVEEGIGLVEAEEEAPAEEEGAEK